MLQQIAGFDVASQEHVSYREEVGWCNVVNTASAIRRHLRSLPKGTIIALESTGGYGLLLARLAHELGFTVYVLQASKVKNFCKSSPSRGKSDKHDARDIAAYIASFGARLHPYTPLPAFEARLRMLCRKKEGMNDHLTALRLMLRALGDTPRKVQSTLRELAGRIKGLEAEIESMLAEADDAQVLYKIPGVKSNLIAAVLPALRTIPFKDKYALDSYAGIDLKMNESGKFVGRRRMSHQGDAHLRRAVYMAGMTATNCKVWKPYYLKLRNEKRLKPVQAINALGRKILHTVFGVYRSQTPFVAPSRA